MWINCSVWKGCVCMSGYISFPNDIKSADFTFAYISCKSIVCELYTRIMRVYYSSMAWCHTSALREIPVCSCWAAPNRGMQHNLIFLIMTISPEEAACVRLMGHVLDIIHGSSVGYYHGKPAGWNNISIHFLNHDSCYLGDTQVLCTHSLASVAILANQVSVS